MTSFSFAHYAVTSNTPKGMVTVFNVDVCESCGTEVCAPNAVHVGPVAEVRALGCTPRPMPTTELSCREDGGDCCTACE